MSQRKIKTLVFSGGSVKGFAHIGALCKLWDDGLLSEIEECIGTSAGAIVACFHAAGFSPYDVWDFIMNIDVSRLVSPNFILLLSSCGLESGDIMYNVMEDTLSKRTNIKNVTFKQLYDITKVKLTITGSCLDTKEVVYFNHETYPDMPVSYAVRISISIPCFFTPFVWEGKKYIDGAVLDNFPIKITEDKIDDTVGILIDSNYSTIYQYAEEFPFAVMNMVLYYFQVKNYEKYLDNTIIIPCNSPEMSTFNFSVSASLKMSLFRTGYQSATDFLLKRKHVEKKNSSDKKYADACTQTSDDEIK